jgi:hypothetical protein
MTGEVEERNAFRGWGVDPINPENFEGDLSYRSIFGKTW